MEQSFVRLILTVSDSGRRVSWSDQRQRVDAYQDSSQASALVSCSGSAFSLVARLTGLDRHGTPPRANLKLASVGHGTRCNSYQIAAACGGETRDRAWVSVNLRH